jgi:uncharacterized protein with PQ loop repeat
MRAAEWIHLADLGQLLTIFLSVLGFLPQLIKLLATKSSDGLSRESWILWVGGNSMTVFYAFVHYQIEGCCLPLLITAAFNTALSVTTLILIMLYRNTATRARSSI